MPRAVPWYFDLGSNKRIYLYRDGKRMEDKKNSIDYVRSVQPHLSEQGTHYIHVSPRAVELTCVALVLQYSSNAHRQVLLSSHFKLH